LSKARKINMKYLDKIVDEEELANRARIHPRQIAFMGMKTESSKMNETGRRGTRSLKP